MRAGRRAFLGLAAAALVARPSAFARAASPPARLRALAFDAFPIFNPAPVAARAEALFPGRGAALVDEWRLRQFEYAWLRALSRQYADFWQVTQDALVFAAAKLKLEPSPEDRAALMGSLLELVAWPDVAGALDALAESGLSLAFLSNFTPRMLEANLERSGLRGRFERLISTDRAGTYKPDPRAYALGPEILGLRREEILFVAHAGWDAAGAKAFGYPTFWVNRAGLPREELGVAPDASGRDLSDLVRFVGARRGGAR